MRAELSVVEAIAETDVATKRIDRQRRTGYIY